MILQRMYGAACMPPFGHLRPGAPQMRFVETELRDAWLIEPVPARDLRGFFARTFCAREFADHGLTARFVQHSTSYSAARGTLRGMHFQRAPHGEAKVVSCLQGVIWDVIIDLRPESPTYRGWRGFELDAENRRQLYVPEGFAHGFQTLCDDTEVGYLISAFYAPHAGDGVRYNDPAFSIDWPLAVSAISAKDRTWPDFVDRRRDASATIDIQGRARTSPHPSQESVAFNHG
jgi:dTDP-4-dehydrorhamnose 3,5-epimerase